MLKQLRHIPLMWRYLLAAALMFLAVVTIWAGVNSRSESELDDLGELRRVTVELEQDYYFGQDIDWDVVYEAAELACEATDEPDKLRIALKVVVERIRDPHARIMETGEPEQTDPASADIAVVSSVKSGVLTVVLPAFFAPTGSAAWLEYVQSGHEALDSSDVCGVILDLRLNTGGNVAAMLGAMGPLLGEGIHLRYIDRSGEVLSSFGWSDGSVISDSGMRVDTKFSRPLDLPDTPVVALTGPTTESAAEGLLVALLARGNMIQIGQPTRGVPTGTAAIKVADSFQLIFTGTAASDRNGAIYDTKIAPRETLRPILPTIYNRAEEILNTEYGCYR